MRGNRLVVALYAGTILLVLVSTAVSLGRDAISDVVLYGILPLTYATVGALVATHDRTNRIGWIFLVFGVYLAAAEVGEGYGFLAADLGLPGADIGTWVISWSWAGEGAAWAVIASIFPDGHLAGPRWRWVPWCAGASFLLAAPGTAFGSAQNNLYPGGVNPYLVDHPAVDLMLGAGSALLAISICGAAVSLVVRLRRARGVERQQLKWFALAACALAVAGSASTVLWQTAPVVVTLLGLVSNALPIAAGIAILRYRLYDIDIVIKRTLVYSTLTVALVATYLVLVLVLQVLLRPLAGDSDLAVAASTLTVAALFRPLRSAIQGVVDRRFFRSRYDAARTLDHFSASLRDELDLDSLGTDLRSVVHDTMQPEHVSLWLRTSGAER